MNAVLKPKLSKAQEQTICRVSRQYISQAMRDIQKDIDALWLVTIARELEVDENRLKSLYRALYEVREEYMEFFESDGYDGLIEIAARHELMKIGIDLNEWHQDLIKTTFTKSETEMLRNVKRGRDS